MGKRDAFSEITKLLGLVCLLYWLKFQLLWQRVIGLYIAMLSLMPVQLLWAIKYCFPSFLDPTAGKRRLLPTTWQNLERDGCHIVVSANPLGDVVVVNVKNKTTFVVSGVPAEFSRAGAKF